MKEIIIFGSAEVASLARYYFDNDSQFKVVGFTVDDDFVKEDMFDGLPLMPYSDVIKFSKNNKYGMHVALSYKNFNSLRRQKYIQARNDGFELVSYISSKSSIAKDFVYGENCFILEDQTIQPNVIFGNNVVLWSGNHIGHGTVVKDHCYIASQVVVSGHCVIDSETFIGVNSTVKDFTKVGKKVFIGMSAVVTRDLEDDSTVIASQSIILNKDDRRAKVLKRKFFD